jgi:hypothetical protein
VDHRRLEPEVEGADGIVSSSARPLALGLGPVWAAGVAPRMIATSSMVMANRLPVVVKARK